LRLASTAAIRSAALASGSRVMRHSAFMRVGAASLIAANLGLKLKQVVAPDGTLAQPAVLCGHGMLLHEYGRVIGTGIWTGKACESLK
jgi:aminoglycoside N3'-acetyltransferase